MTICACTLIIWNASHITLGVISRMSPVTSAACVYVQLVVVPVHAKSNPTCVVALHRVVLRWLVDVGGKEGGDTGAKEGETQPAAKGEARGEKVARREEGGPWGFNEPI